MQRVKRDLVQMVLAGSSDDEGAALYSDVSDGGETETAEVDAHYRSLIDEWSEAIAHAYGAPPGRPVADTSCRTAPASGRTAPETSLRDAAMRQETIVRRAAPEAGARTSARETKRATSSHGRATSSHGGTARDGGTVARVSGGGAEATTPTLGAWAEGAMVWEWA